MNLKKNEHGVYIARFKTAQGTTSQVTTRCTSLDEAKKVVKESGLADLELAAKAGRLTREAVGHITTGKRLTVSMAIDQWVAWMKAKARAPKTIYNCESTVRRWATDTEVEKLPPSAVTAKPIDKWVNAAGVSKAQTRKVNLSAIRSFFGFCAARGWCIIDPSMDVDIRMDGLSHSQKERNERKPFTKEELAKITAELERRGDVFWQFAVAANLETGMRLGDVCQLEWECFTEPGKIAVWTDKRNKRLELKVSEKLMRLVTEIPVSSPKYLFPEQRECNADVKRRAALSMQFKRICESLDIEGKSFHCLRHTFATQKFQGKSKSDLAKRLADALSIEEISQLLGHSKAGTTKGYIH